MKQIIIIATLSFVATVWAIPNEKCRQMPNATFEDCCPLGFDLIPKEVYQKCEAAFPMGPPPPPPPPGTIPGPPRGCCKSECVLKELKIYSDGKLSKDAAKTYLINTVKAKPELKAIVEAAVEKCATEGEAKKAFFDEGAKLPPLPPANQTCNMISGFMIGCVHAEILINCPSLAQKQECSDLKQFATDCKFIFNPKKAPVEKAA